MLQPIEEYETRAPGVNLATKPWTWRQIRELVIGKMGASPSWLFLWVGSGEGLKKGRECMQVWGYKRAEDITWLKTNHDSVSRQQATRGQMDGCLEHTTEHCLMG